jgi:hypothetical protein
VAGAEVGRTHRRWRVLRLIKPWLRAGVLGADGQVLHPATGRPQGGSRSPFLANVYFHYALDLWCHKVVKPRCRGEACLIRDADDFGCAVQHQVDAERLYLEVGRRLSTFGLEGSADKRRGIPCSRQQAPGHISGHCLGFGFRWGQDRTGKPHLKRRTSVRCLSWQMAQSPQSVAELRPGGVSEPVAPLPGRPPTSRRASAYETGHEVLGALYVID